MSRAALTGQPGKVYGLQVRDTKSVKVVPQKPRPTVFANDDDDDESAKVQLAKEQARKAKQQEKERQAALAQDASVFDYDGVYDGMQAAKKSQHEAKVVEEKKQLAKAKYIPDLLKKAEFRLRENDIIYNKNLLRDREKDDHMFADKEKFVTSGYKEKIEQDKLWQEEQAKKEAAESDVSKSSMTSFYSNLLQARAGAVPVSSISTSSSSTTSPSSKTSSDTSISGNLTRNEEVGSERPLGRSRKDLTLEHEELLRVEQKRKREQEERAKLQAEKLRKRHDDASVQSARERYLARKKLKTEPPSTETPS